MFKLYSLFLLALASTVQPILADVGDLWLDVNVGTLHSESTYRWEGEIRGYNQQNFGLGLAYQSHKYLFLKAGWFENSYEKTSAYALANAEFSIFKWRRFALSPGVAAGLVTGYDDTPEDAADIAPWGILTLGVSFDDRWRLNIGYLPSSLILEGGTDVGIGQLSYRF